MLFKKLSKEPRCLLQMSTSFKLACQAAEAVRNLSPVRLPDVSVTAKAYQKLQALPETAPTVSAIDLNVIAREIAARLESGEELSRKQLREAPWCLWKTQPALAEDAGLLERLLRITSDSTSARPFRTLATAFMSAYGEQQAGRGAVAAVLSRLALKWKGVWGFLHNAYSIFDLVEGPRRLALEVHTSNRSPAEILSEAGLGAMNAGGDFIKAVVHALLIELAEGAERNHLARLEKVKRFALRADGLPLFESQRYQMVEALLRPFVDRSPDEPTQDEYLRVIVKAFGDPRLRQGNWVGLPHKEIATGWLTRQSLRQFLDVVDDTTIDRDAKRMWKYRRAFWEGMYEFYRRNGFSVEAWVAFGPNGKRVARNAFKNAEFATLHTDGKNVHSDHAVLLFRVGDCLVADWNHNGKCHVWTSAGQRGAPKLYERQYGSNDVQIFTGQGHHETAKELSWGHGGSENHSWQQKIAGRLGSITGMRIPESAYRLR
jgi:hypothetical protein